MNHKTILAAPMLSLFTLVVAGCGHQQQQPYNMAPPITNNGQQMGQQNMAPPVNQGYQQAQNGQQSGDQQQSAGVYQWQDVPQGQQVQVTRATFDQGGYQIFAATGETIVVPFVNQNLYALKFGKTPGQTYFINDGQAPVLYLAPGSYLENAAAQNARWYPIPNDYAYSQPMYVSVAPSWADYAAMGWYPGMNYYGGMWGYHPYGAVWMPGMYVSIYGSRYASYTSYHSYYIGHPGYVRTTTVYRNYSSPRGTTFGSRSFASGSRGSFGSGNRSTFGSSANNSRGSFGSGASTARPFGGSRPSGGSSFGGSRPSGGSSFGGSRPSGGSSFGGSRPSGGSSFGGSRSSGGSFGRRR